MKASFEGVEMGALKFRPQYPPEAEEMESWQGKDLDVTVKRWRERRSLDANAYFWKLAGLMAEALGTSKEEIYLMMLERYGVYTHLIVKPKVVDRIKREWRTVIDLGEVTVNGQTGIQLQCFFGSSTYDSKEMSRLIDGTIHDAKTLGISTESPEEIARMKEEWGK